MVHFLFDGNDVEYVDDERHQYDHHQNVDKAADIGGIAPFGQQKPLQLFSQYVTSRVRKGAGRKLGGASCLRPKCGENYIPGMVFVCV